MKVNFLILFTQSTAQNIMRGHSKLDFPKFQFEIKPTSTFQTVRTVHFETMYSISRFLQDMPESP